MSGYDPTTLWVVVVLVGLGTLALRFSFVAAFAYVDEVPARVRWVLGFVPAAVLAALVAPAVLAPGGAPGAGLAAPRVGAAALAAVVAWRTGSVAATIGVGMVALWGLRAVVG